MTRPSARLDRLTRRANAVVGRTNPLPMVAVVYPADADHPRGTRMFVGQGVDVYHDFATGEP